MKHQLKNKQEIEKAILIGIELKSAALKSSEEYLDELEFLASTAGAETLQRFTQRLEMPNPKTYVGKGKLEELQVYVSEKGVDLAIFDDELSPSQIINLE